MSGKMTNIKKSLLKDLKGEKKRLKKMLAKEVMDLKTYDELLERRNKTWTERIKNATKISEKLVKKMVERLDELDEQIEWLEKVEEY